MEVLNPKPFLSLPDHFWPLRSFLLSNGREVVWEAAKKWSQNGPRGLDWYQNDPEMGTKMVLRDPTTARRPFYERILPFF